MLLRVEDQLKDLYITSSGLPSSGRGLEDRGQGHRRGRLRGESSGGQHPW